MPPKTAATPHIGRKIERIRTLKGIKQEDLASMIGVRQGTMSKIEQSEEVDEQRLQQIAEALEVSAEAIKNFNEEAIINHMNNIHNNNDSSVNAVIYYQLSPTDKVVQLYERLLKGEQERNKELEARIKELEVLLKGKK